MHLQKFFISVQLLGCTSELILVLFIVIYIFEVIFGLFFGF